GIQTLAILAASVDAIDGVPVPLPSSEAQIEAAVMRLGDEGLSAVADTLDRSDDPALEQNAGNSHGTPT
ncbi:MAG: hypothetical protein J0H99_10015, partial [Rhodospirillales bacterium]|nr:hypothetical protein [Rhodospirillales bacterium]